MANEHDDSLNSILVEAHELLEGAGVPDAIGQACDDPACNSRLGHRLRTLISERDDLRKQLEEQRAK